MIAFNKALMHTTFLVDEASNLKAAGFISNDDFITIKNKIPALKSNKNILLRFGFFWLKMVFLLTWFSGFFKSSIYCSI